MSSRPSAVTCCAAGGGPAGMMPGLLLARAGVPVPVLEKHAGFLRDLLGRSGLLGRLPARLAGVGIRPEHVETPLLV
jgi:2-polyprenyl-6-methoxyphenol hydroxylase-like FAD-dependent oxidoreductase